MGSVMVPIPHAVTSFPPNLTTKPLNSLDAQMFARAMGHARFPQSAHCIANAIVPSQRDTATRQPTVLSLSKGVKIHGNRFVQFWRVSTAVIGAAQRVAAAKTQHAATLMAVAMALALAQFVYSMVLDAHLREAPNASIQFSVSRGTDAMALGVAHGAARKVK